MLAFFCFLAGAAGGEEGTAGPAPSQQGKSSLTVDGQLPRLFASVADGSGWPRMLAQADSAEAPEAVSPPPKPLKSPGRALLYSAMLPGAGEFYAGARKRAVLFFGLEAAAWGLYFSWNGKGKDIEKDFRGGCRRAVEGVSYMEWRGSTISRYLIDHPRPCRAARSPTSSTAGRTEFRVPRGREAAVLRADREVRPVRLRMGRRQGPGRQPGSADRDRLGRELRFRAALRLRGPAQRQQQVPQRATNVLGVILVNHVISAIDASRAARLTARGAGEAALQRRTRFAFVRGGPSGKTPMVLAWKPLF